MNAEDALNDARLTNEALQLDLEFNELHGGRIERKRLEGDALRRQGGALDAVSLSVLKRVVAAASSSDDAADDIADNTATAVFTPLPMMPLDRFCKIWFVEEDI